MSQQRRPIDLAAVAADDAQLDALGTACLGDDTEETFRLLARWRQKVRAQPIGELVDADTALAAIQAGRPRRRWRIHQVIPAAVAVLLIVGSALGLASHQARPGDGLYPLRVPLFGEYVPPRPPEGDRCAR